MVEVKISFKFVALFHWPYSALQLVKKRHKFKIDFLLDQMRPFLYCLCSRKPFPSYPSLLCNQKKRVHLAIYDKSLKINPLHLDKLQIYVLTVIYFADMLHKMISDWREPCKRTKRNCSSWLCTSILNHGYWWYKEWYDTFGFIKLLKSYWTLCSLTCANM